jgi:hypothetical protein
VIKSAVLLVVSRATVSKFMSTYTNHGKKTSAKRNSGRNSTVTERDSRILGRIVSKSSTTTSAVVFPVDSIDAPIDWLENDHAICVYCRSLSVSWLYKKE